MTNKGRANYWWRWGIDNGEPPCGHGSTFENTREVSVFIETVIKDLSIKSINDCGCGDYSFWMNRVNIGDALYRGYDINDELILQNQMKFPEVFFEEADITEQILPKADLIICRDVLFHLPTDMAIRALDRFVKSCSSFLIATTFESVRVNNEITDKIDGPELGYGHRKLNMSIEPFNLGAPIAFVSEPKFKRVLGLWRMESYS